MPDYEVDPQRQGGYGDTPRTEIVKGTNIPYRGIVDHGVPGTEMAPDDEAHYYDNARPVIYEDSPLEHDPEPIPVRVVQGETARQIRQTRIWNIPLPPGSVVQVVGRDRTRTKVRIGNTQSNVKDIHVSTDPSPVIGVNTWKLQPLPQELEILGGEPVWILPGVSGAGTESAQVMAEYIVEYKGEDHHR